MNADKATKEIYEALETFEQDCKAVANESPVTRLQAEGNAFDELTGRVAEIYGEVPDAEPGAGRVAQVVADVSHSMTKTDARQEIANRSQAERKDVRSDRVPLDKWVKENLREVSVVRSTDHHHPTTYVWDFGSTMFETEGGVDSRGHYSWINFRDLIDEAGGPYLADPRDPYTDTVEWRAWIVDRRQEHETRKTHVGPRTTAVHALQNRVRQHDAFGSLSDAVDYQGTYVELADESERPDDMEPVDTDASPQELPEWRVGTLYVPNTWPTDIADEHNIGPSALQNELDARGYTLGGRNKVATHEYVDGRKRTFWVLTGDFATPAAYQPEGEAADHTGVGALDAADAGKANDRDFGGLEGSN